MLSNSRVESLRDDRLIVLLDLDCFYAQVESKRLGLPPSVPLAVQQWGALIAVNYAARSFGVSRGDNALSASKKCPSIQLPHVRIINQRGELVEGANDFKLRSSSKVSLSLYRSESSRIHAIFRRFGVCERASIDEAYIDISEPIGKLFARCRQSGLALAAFLAMWHAEMDDKEKVEVEKEKDKEKKNNQDQMLIANQSPDAPSSSPPSSSWTPASSSVSSLQSSSLVLSNSPPMASSGALANHHVEDEAEAVDEEDKGGAEGEDEAEEEEESKEHQDDADLFDWKGHVIGGCYAPESDDDIRMILASHYVHRVRRTLKALMGYTCSSGLAHNKKFAKVIASRHKPDGQTSLPLRSLSLLLHSTPINKIQGLGAKMGVALQKFCGMDSMPTLGAVADRYTQAQLSNHFGEENGRWIYLICRGFNFDPVKPVESIKSFAATKNLVPAAPFAKVAPHLRLACMELILRLHEAHASTNQWPKNLTVHYYASKGRELSSAPHHLHLHMNAHSSHGGGRSNAQPIVMPYSLQC